MPRAATAAAAPVGGPGSWIDPYGAYNFKLVIQGVTHGHFTRCSGIRAQVHAIAYREGGEGQIVRQVPGRVEYAALELKYGLTDSTELWDWFMKSVAGTVERRNVSIVVLGPDGATEALRWNLINCWPSAWEGVPLDALAREVAIESLTLVFESVERS